MSSIELLNEYYAQTNADSSSSMYTEHDDNHWDRDSYDDYDFNGNSTTDGGYADQHIDSYHYDD